MRLPDIPFTAVDWNALPVEEHPGEAGTSRWKTFDAEGLRARVVEYGPGFRSDHWCPKGHILMVVEGTLSVELKDGRRFDLSPHFSHHVVAKCRRGLWMQGFATEADEGIVRTMSRKADRAKRRRRGPIRHCSRYVVRNAG